MYLQKEDKKAIGSYAPNEWRWIFDRIDAVVYMKPNRIIDYKSETIKWLVQQKVRQWVIIRRIGSIVGHKIAGVLIWPLGSSPDRSDHLFMWSSGLDIYLLTMSSQIPEADTKT